jgi:hypothetical protein
VVLEQLAIHLPQQMVQIQFLIVLHQLVVAVVVEATHPQVVALVALAVAVLWTALQLEQVVLLHHQDKAMLVEMLLA